MLLALSIWALTGVQAQFAEDYSWRAVEIAPWSAPLCCLTQKSSLTGALTCGITTSTLMSGTRGDVHVEQSTRF